MALLFKILCKRKALSLITLCSSGIPVTVTLWWNMQLGEIINQVGAGHPPPGAAITPALAAIFVTAVSNYAINYITGYTCERMAHDLRMGYARYFTSLSAAEAEKLNAGEQLSKLQNEIAGVSDYLNTNLFQLAGDAVRFSVTFIWLALVSPTLTLASTLPVIPIVVYVFWSSNIIGSATKYSQEAKGQMNQYADTLLTLFPIIRLYDAARLALGGYRSAIAAWEKHTIRSEYTAARLMSLSGVLSGIPLLFLFLAGGNMVIKGSLSVGTLYIFLNLSGNVSGVLMNIPRYIASFRQFSANMKRLEGKICL